MEPITEDQLRGCVAETMKMEPAEIEVSEELYDQGMNSLQLGRVS